MQPSYVVGVLDPSFIELLGDGTSDGDVIGDPNVASEIAVAVLGGNNLVKWNSPWQLSVDVPLLGGARFKANVTDVSRTNADIKAIVAAYYNSLLENPMFVDAFSGVNAIAQPPTQIVLPNGVYPSGGVAIFFVSPTLSYPPAGSTSTFVMPSLSFPAAGSALTFPQPTPTFPSGGSSSTATIPTPTFPPAGSSSTPTAIPEIYPPAGIYVPWSNANSLALAYLTDQYL